MTDSGISETLKSVSVVSRQACWQASFCSKLQLFNAIRQLGVVELWQSCLLCRHIFAIFVCIIRFIVYILHIYHLSICMRNCTPRHVESKSWLSWLIIYIYYDMHFARALRPGLEVRQHLPNCFEQDTARADNVHSAYRAAIGAGEASIRPAGCLNNLVRTFAV